MEFRVLGPVEVEGAPALGGPKQRALLVHLLLVAGEAVPAARLIDAVWGDEPPASAAHALQVYVSQLRKAIARTGAEIRRRGAGYELVLGEARVDALAFGELAREGRARMARGDAAGARQRLSAALSLWRGTPEVDGPGLDAQRAAAEDDLTDAELALGAGADLVPRLERRAREHPLRERTCGQLMTALYRAGRQSDALAAYRSARSALADVGLEPSADLRALERAVLRHDPTLAPAPPSRSELPAPATPLVGREAETRDVLDALADSRLVTLTGPGGTGKTRLALEAAARLGIDVRFVPLAAIDDPALVRGTIAAEVETTGDDLADALRERRLLLVLDNFEQVDDAAPVVGELLLSAPRLAVLVTSRSPLRVYGERVVAVPPLSRDEAQLLFAARSGITEDDGGKVLALCDALDRLPLAIELVAARSQELSLDEMLDALPLDLARDGPRDVPERQRTLRATVAWSRDLLDERLRTVFDALGVFAGGWTADAAADVFGATDDDLRELELRSLVRREGGRWSMLQTIREYVLDRLSDEDAAHLRRAHAEHFMRFAADADVAMETSRDRAAWYARLAPELENVRAALAWSREHAPLLHLKLAAAFRNFWRIRGLAPEAVSWLGPALEAAPDAPAEVRAKAFFGLQASAFSLGDYATTEDALLESLALYRRVGDDRWAARCLGELAGVRASRGDLDGAEPLYVESAALLREANDRFALGVVVSNLGELWATRGDYDRAAELYAEGVAISRDAGFAEAAATSLYNLGYTELSRGDLARARSVLLEALAAIRDLDYRELGAYCLQGFAELALAEGEPDRAARLIGAADATFAAAGVGIQPREAEHRARALEALAAELSASRLAELRAAGEALDFDAACGFAGE